MWDIYIYTCQRSAQAVANITFETAMHDFGAAYSQHIPRYLISLPVMLSIFDINVNFCQIETKFTSILLAYDNGTKSK
jgi:hypothetical protein